MSAEINSPCTDPTIQKPASLSGLDCSACGFFNTKKCIPAKTRQLNTILKYSPEEIAQSVYESMIWNCPTNLPVTADAPEAKAIG